VLLRLLEEGAGAGEGGAGVVVGLTPELERTGVRLSSVRTQIYEYASQKHHA
jgi:hypothetical protein